MNSVTKAYIQLHICVFLWGFTAILGKVISISALPLVWWRVLLTCVALIFTKNLFGQLKTISRRNLLIYAGIGILVSIHWIFFYAAIKASNASVGVLCMAFTPVCTTFIDPFFMKRRIRWYELVLSLIAVLGMYFVVQEVDPKMIIGIGFGLFSAFMAATFSVLNKIYILDADPIPITFIELASGFVFISIVLPFYQYSTPEMQFMPVTMDWIYLIVLSVGCTAVPFVLSLYSLRYLSAFITNLSINLEPVYGIVLAWLLLGEDKELTPGFYFGVLIILLSVFSYPFLKKLSKDPI